MARGSIWISYDPRDDRRNSGRRRRWLWFLLVALIALVALGLIGFGVSQVDVPEIQLGQPVAIQEALPALVNDHSAIVYVVDDSGSMYVKLASLHEALKNLAEKSSENSEIALFQFGDAPRCFLISLRRWTLHGIRGFRLLQQRVAVLTYTLRYGKL